MIKGKHGRTTDTITEIEEPDYKTLQKQIHFVNNKMNIIRDALVNIDDKLNDLNNRLGKIENDKR